jgi:hypothetical protein
MKKTSLLTLPVLLSALVLSVPAAPARAQDAPSQSSLAQTDIMPVKAASEVDIAIDETNPTHPPVKLTPDKSELIRLDRKASTVLVGAPAHLNILPEGPNTLVLIPRAPGATYFTVLDGENKVIMQRHVIVASPKEKYVRIRKSCATSKGCQPTQVYYCPDMCHEIILNDKQGIETAKSDAVGSEISDAVGEENDKDAAADKPAENADENETASEGEETTEE